MTLFDSYSYYVVSAAIGVQNTEVANLGVDNEADDWQVNLAFCLLFWHFPVIFGVKQTIGV